MPLQKPAPAARRTKSNAQPRPDLTGSLICLLGLFLTGLLLDGELTTDVARFGAIGTALSLAASFYCDARHGLQNLVRADLLALVSLYYLTFFEFLFPQPNFVTMVDLNSAQHGVIACLFGYAGIVAGRHLLTMRRQPLARLFTAPVSPTLIIIALTLCFCVGFSYMLACSDFKPGLMVWWFFEPRFSQPWSRQALGDWKAMLHEFEMCLYLVPPLAGVIFARRHRYAWPVLILVGLMVGFVMFYGFCNGSRYYLAAYLVTMLAGFAFASPVTHKKQVIVAAIVAAALMIVSTVLMLNFRNMGLHDYLSHNYEDLRRPGEGNDSIFVDFNLYVICRITDTFPKQHHYLGLEIPYLAIIRPVPRALWPTKPEGMTFPIEDVIGARGWTVAATFIGESYMSGGNLGVFLAGAVLGLLAQWWNLLASPRNSEFGVLVYASGFFAAAIAMRSVLVLTTALMPCGVAIVAGLIFIRRGAPRTPLPRPAVPGPAPLRP